MEKKEIAKILILFGLFFIITGFLFLFERPFSFLFRLPGDIRIEKENFSLYIPITTMVLLSVILTLILNIILRLFR